MILRGRAGGAIPAVDLHAEISYSFSLRRASTSTLKLPLIAHHCTQRRTGCTLAGCSPMRLKAWF